MLAKRNMRKRIIGIAVVVGLILLIPLAMMLIDAEGWHWGPGDFAAAGLLLFGTGLAIDFAARRLTNKVHRIFAITAIVVLLLIIWGGMIDNTGERLLEKLFCGGAC